MTLLISGFLVRFFIFWLKIALAALFVILLQVQVGQKSLEQWIEEGLKQSKVSQYLRGMAQTDREMINKKFPIFNSLVQNKIRRNNAIVEWHSGLFKQAEQAFDNFDQMGEESPDQRTPTSR